MQRASKPQPKEKKPRGAKEVERGERKGEKEEEEEEETKEEGLQFAKVTMVSRCRFPALQNIFPCRFVLAFVL
jgi:hypothetical protein